MAKKKTRPNFESRLPAGTLAPLAGRTIPLSLNGEVFGPGPDGLEPMYQGTEPAGKMMAALSRNLTMPMERPKDRWDTREIADPVPIVKPSPLRSALMQPPSDEPAMPSQRSTLPPPADPMAKRQPVVSRATLDEIANARSTPGDPFAASPTPSAAPQATAPKPLLTGDAWLDAYRQSRGMSSLADARAAQAEEQPTRQTVTIDGEEFGVNGSPSPGTGVLRMPETRVGVGRQSNGMVTGGGFGSSLMMSGAAVPGMAMGAVPPRQQPELTPSPRVGTAPVSEGDFASAWAGRKMTASDPAKQAAAQEKRATEMDLRSALAGQRGMAKGQARTDRLEFQNDAQKTGLIGALTKRGIDPVTVMAQQEIANGGPQSQEAIRYVSEANRQAGVRGEFADRNAIERERLGLDRERQQFEQNWLQQQPQPLDEQTVVLQQAGQAAYDAAIAANKTPQEAEAAAAQASMGKWKTYGSPEAGAIAAAGQGPQTSGVSGSVIAALEGSSDPAQRAMGKQMRRRNQELEDARRRTGWGGLRGIWEDWGVK